MVEEVFRSLLKLKYHSKYSFKGALCNFFNGPVNKQRDRALDTRNSSLQVITWLLDVL